MYCACDSPQKALQKVHSVAQDRLRTVTISKVQDEIIARLSIKLLDVKI